jgi:DNA-binding response OmpR family regulator
MLRGKILLIDDEQHIVDVVVYILEENSYDVITALDGDTGMALFESEEPALVVLDINLPGLSGLDLFREMRKQRPNQPIIMLTSRSDEIDRVVGLEMGADDYVTKPFSPRELAARVRAVLRRMERQPVSGEGERYSVGPLVVDSEGLVLTYHGKPVKLTRPEFKLMECLVRYPARVFPRDLLIEHLYDGEHFVTDRSIDAHVKRLRKKLSSIHSGVNPIETVHGLGYKLNQDIESDE